MRITLLLFVCLLLANCVSTSQVSLHDFSKEGVALPFKIEQLEIVDSRESLLPMNWDVPRVSAKKREWVGNPALSDLNKSDIRGIILQSESKDGVPVHMEFRVLEGVCKIQADWKSVTEFAKFRGELRVEVPSRNYIYVSSAEMFYENPTLDGTEKGTMVLYNQAVKNVTHMTLKHIKEQIKL